MKALGLVVSKKKIILCLSHCKSMGPNDPGVGLFLTPGAWLAGFIKRTNTHCHIRKYERSRPCGFGEEDFLMPSTKYEEDFFMFIP